MSLLGKYRRDEADKDDDETTTIQREPHEPTKTSELHSAVPNKERKSPIVSFSIPTDASSKAGLTSKG